MSLFFLILLLALLVATYLLQWRWIPEGSEADASGSKIKSGGGTKWAFCLPDFSQLHKSTGIMDNFSIHKRFLPVSAAKILS